MSSGLHPTLTAPTTTPNDDTCDEVELLMPVHTASAGAARTVATTLAAHSLVDFESAALIRLAVGDVCAALAAVAEPDSVLRCHFRSSQGIVQVRVQARTSHLPRGAEHDPGWRWLTAQADSLRVTAHHITADLSTTPVGIPPEPTNAAEPRTTGERNTATDELTTAFGEEAG